MKIFLDSADLEEIKAALRTGYLDGLTTNPSLVAKTGESYESLAEQLVKVVRGDISVEVLATEYNEMIKETRKYSKLGDNIIVKLPFTPDGLRACKTLSDHGYKVNMTLIFSPVQALLAAKAGAYYASIFVGRIDDGGSEGEDVIAETRLIYENYGFTTKILFASVRTIEQVKNAAVLGADVVTVPFSVFMQLPNHPLTEVGLNRFLTDYRQSQKVESEGTKPLA